MSAQQLPYLQKLKQQQEVESYQSREQYRQSASKPSSEDPPVDVPPLPSQSQEVKPVIEVDEDRLIAKRYNIFAGRKENQPVNNLFANSKSVNLFSQAGSLNIFALSGTATRPQDDLVSHGSDNCEPSPKEQDLPEPSCKEMKFEYRSETRQLDSFRLTKFKKGCEPARELMDLALEEHRGQLLLVFRNQTTHVLVHKAYLLPKAPFHSFMNRQDNLEVQTLAPSPLDPNKPERNSIKMQFQEKEEARRFRQTIEDFWQQPILTTDHPQQEHCPKEATEVRQQQETSVELKQHQQEVKQHQQEVEVKELQNGETGAKQQAVVKARQQGAPQDKKEVETSKPKEANGEVQGELNCHEVIQQTRKPEPNEQIPENNHKPLEVSPNKQKELHESLQRTEEKKVEE